MDELLGFSEINEVRGKGLMIGAEFDFPIADLRKKLLYEQLVFTGASSNENTLRLLPPLNISDKEVDQFVSALKNVLE